MAEVAEKETRISIRVDADVKEFLEAAAGKVYRPLSNYLIYCGIIYAIRELGMRIEEYVPDLKLDPLMDRRM